MDQMDKLCTLYNPKKIKIGWPKRGIQTAIVQKLPQKELKMAKSTLWKYQRLENVW